MITRSWLLVLSLTFLQACGVEVENHPTDLTVRVVVAPEGKGSVVEVLDRLTSEKGWVRTPAAAGLKELHNRDVIFFSYGRTPKDMLVTIHDLKKVTELEVSAFFEASEPGLVEGVVATFSNEVKSVPGVSAVYEERRTAP
jgi:hypothetical protein